MGRKPNTIEDCHRLAKERGGKCLSEEYVNSGTKYQWQCGESHYFDMRYNQIANQNQWCPECGKVKGGLSRRKTIKDCQKLAAERGGKCLSEEYVDARIKYLWQCGEDHEPWPTTYAKIRDGHWCPKCAHIRSRNTLEDCHDLARKKKGKFLSKEYTGNKENYLWQCGECNHIWPARYDNVKKKSWCPQCGRLKAARNQNNSHTLHHWKTGQELVCQGGWEKAVVEYFNQNKINFQWQPRTFIMPDGRTYRPDCYLPDQDLWIEIKGYMREHNRIKWDWFHIEYSNSELWNKEKLKELEILP